MIARRFSCAAFGEPGSVIISVLFRIPATGRDMMATAYFVSLLCLKPQI